MDRIFFDFNGVLALEALILGLVLTVLLYRLHHKERHTWLLAKIFVSLTVMMACLGTLIQVQGEWTFFLVFALVLLDVTFLLLLQFAYHFPETDESSHSRVALIVGVIVPILVFFSLLRILRFDSEGWALSIDRYVISALGAQVFRFGLFLWVFYVLPRKILYYESDENCSVLMRMCFPKTKRGRTIRAITGTFSLGLILPFSVVLQFLGFIDQELQAMIFILGTILIFAVFFVIYINYMPERSGFMVKLVGVSLLIVLAVIAFCGYFMDLHARNTWEQARMSDLERVRSQVIRGEALKPPDLVNYVLLRPEFGHDYQALFTRDENYDPDRAARWDVIRRDRQVRGRGIMLSLIEGLDEHEARFRARVEIEHDGLPMEAPLERISDRQLIGIYDHDLYYLFEYGGQTYEVGFSYMDYRSYLHEVNGNTAAVMVVATIGLLIFYPLFFRRGLMQPLEDLLEGVREVNSGKMNVSVPIHASDEIGYVAGAFNTMVENVAAARERALTEERERVRLAAENERKTQELEEARQLQLSMLPEQLPQLPGIKLATYTNPATEVGGDYYDFHVSDGTLTIAVGDATGHGLRAGTMVTATKSLFQVLTTEHEPLEILAKSSEALHGLGFETMYMALSIGTLKDNKLRLTAAGMPYTLLYRAAEHQVERLELRGLPLGSGIIFPYQELERTLEPGDTLLFQSDGLEERFNETGEMLGENAVIRRFRAIAKREPQEIVDDLIAFGNQWAGNREADDDVTLVVLQVGPQES